MHSVSWTPTPIETALVCPSCGASDKNVFLCSEPREVWKDGARQQDRWCVRCGYKGVTVLPSKMEMEAFRKNRR